MQTRQKSTGVATLRHTSLTISAFSAQKGCVMERVPLSLLKYAQHFTFDPSWSCLSLWKIIQCILTDVTAMANSTFDSCIVTRYCEYVTDFNITLKLCGIFEPWLYIKRAFAKWVVGWMITLLCMQAIILKVYMFCICMGMCGLEAELLWKNK